MDASKKKNYIRYHIIIKESDDKKEKEQEFLESCRFVHKLCFNQTFPRTHNERPVKDVNYPKFLAELPEIPVPHWAIKKQESKYKIDFDHYVITIENSGNEKENEYRFLLECGRVHQHHFQSEQEYYEAKYFEEIKVQEVYLQSFLRLLY